MSGKNGSFGNITIGLQMGVTIFVFVYGGYRLDLYFNLFPVLLICGTLFGMIAAFYNMLKDVKDQERNENEQEKEKKNKVRWR